MKRVIFFALAALVFLSACSNENPSYKGKTASEWIHLADNSDPDKRAEAEAALKELYDNSDAAAERYRQIYAARLDTLYGLIDSWLSLSQEDRTDFIDFCVLFDQTARMACSTPADMQPVAERMKTAMTIYDTDDDEFDLFNQIVEPRIQFYNSLSEER